MWLLKKQRNITWMVDVWVEVGGIAYGRDSAWAGGSERGRQEEESRKG